MLPGTHDHYVKVNGIDLHYVSAGSGGSPVLLIHGFPETWWAFHKVIPLLAGNHRVFAVDLRGFGDSSNAAEDFSSKTVAEDLHALIADLHVGPVHITTQDVSGTAAFRLASKHPADVLSFTAIEAGLPGFGLEKLADVTQGGSWHIGMLAAPHVPEMLLPGREREFLKEIAFPALCIVPFAVSESDLDEFVRTYSRPNAWRGASGLYQSLLKDASEIKNLAESHRLTMPVLAIGAGGGDMTQKTMTAAVGSPVETERLLLVGHYPALEAPDRLSKALLRFWSRVDGRSKNA